MASAHLTAAEPAWSPTRETILQACPRRYFYHYYQASGGWSARADGATKHAYRLRQLTTFDLVLGTAVHGCANLLVRAITTGRARPSFPDLRDRVRAALNQVWKTSQDRAAFVRDPGGHAMLLPVYYNREISPEMIERIRIKLEACVRNLVEWPLWRLVELPSTSVHVGTDPVRLQVGGTPMWAAPDLIIRPEDHSPILVEWKTGRIDEDKTMAQVTAYGLFLRDGLGIHPGPDGYEAAVVDLLRGQTHTLTIQDADLQSAEERIRAGHEAMREFLVPGTSLPRAMREFPLAVRRADCPRCNFWEICEVRRRFSSPGLAPSDGAVPPSSR